MSRSPEEIVREGTYTPLRKKRRPKPYFSLTIQFGGWGLLTGETWKGERIFAMLSRQEVEEWNRNLARIKPKFLGEGR
jgi:hypothetical protein